LSAVECGSRALELPSNLRVGGSNPSGRAKSKGSIPVGQVAFYTGDMGNSFAAKGFAALSIRQVS